ncbi:hypothetical protein ABLE91_17185 [Aquabacter sp. CN5-332]|uniref:hypothetical protein n=1 Tax=Aquabacter sp. CN5-332 TaxID=3156608 RepID=UPI0032B5E18F
MSEFREFGTLRVGASAADPEALARAVRKHKAGDVMTQAALTLALMLAICAVTFVLSVDRAAAMTLAHEEVGMVSHALVGATLTAAIAAAIGATLIATYRRAQARLVRVPVRARRTRG